MFYVIRPSRWRLELGLMLVVGLAAAIWWTLPPSAVPAETEPADRELPVYSVETSEKKVAISFDAAWGAERTPELLEILEQHHVKTTFFLVSFWIEDYPEVTRSIAAAGHEIGLHSDTHPHMRTMSKQQIKAELEKNHQALEAAGVSAAPLFRPPFGEYDNDVVTAAKEEGFLPVQWSLDSLDWKETTRAAIVDRIVSNVRAGDIILFHNNGEHTAAALGEILTSLEDQGYEVVPVSELVYFDDYIIDHQGRQHPIEAAPSMIPDGVVREAYAGFRADVD